MKQRLETWAIPLNLTCEVTKTINFSLHFLKIIFSNSIILKYKQILPDILSYQRKDLFVSSATLGVSGENS